MIGQLTGTSRTRTNAIYSYICVLAILQTPITRSINDKNKQFQHVEAQQ